MFCSTSRVSKRRLSPEMLIRQPVGDVVSFI